MAKKRKATPKPAPEPAPEPAPLFITPEQARQLADIYRTFRRYYGQQARKKKSAGKR
jgi:hypothetical protein